MSATRPELVKKSGTKSVVWDFFGLAQGRDGKPIDDGSVICRSCRRRVIARSGNTSNLLAHLKANHPKIYSEAKESMSTKERPRPSTTQSRPSTSATQATLIESLEKTQKYEKKGKKWKDLTDSVTYCIAKDNLLIHTVEKTGFQKMLTTFDGIPSRSYFSKTATPLLYTSVKERVKEELGTVKYFSATTDLWSSIAGMCPYISYTVHFVDQEWNLQSRCLQTQFIPQDHTGANLAEAMEAVLSSWDLDAANQF